MQYVSFKRMDEGTSKDYAFLNALEDKFVVSLPDRLLAALTSLEDSLALDIRSSRLEHSLQSATRAEE
jgi:predicted HD phosphohydrolase